MGRGVGARELWVVIGVAMAGLLLAAVAALSPWYHGPGVSRTPIVEIIAPAGMVDEP